MPVSLNVRAGADRIDGRVDMVWGLCADCHGSRDNSNGDSEAEFSVVSTEVAVERKSRQGVGFGALSALDELVEAVALSL